MIVTDKPMDWLTKGKIPLVHENAAYEASFCIMKVPASIEELRSCLHETESRYHDSLKFTKRRTDYLAGRYCAKQAIIQLYPACRAEQMAIGYGMLRFPVIKAPGVENTRVTITHCGEFAMAVAFPDYCLLGIDLERMDAERENAVRDQLTAAEEALVRTIAPMSPAEGCIALWTMREALSKALQTGFTVDLDILAVSAVEWRDGFWRARYRCFAQFECITIPLKGYFFSLALPLGINTMVDTLREGLFRVIGEPR